MKDSQRKAIHAKLKKHVSGIGVIKTKDMGDNYPLTKPFLVVRLQPHPDRTITYTPKKSFNDLPDAIKYSEKLGKKHNDVNLHENPSCKNKPCSEDDIAEFRHGTKDWHNFKKEVKSADAIRTPNDEVDHEERFNASDRGW